MRERRRQRAGVAGAALACGVLLHAVAASPQRALADVRTSFATSTDPFAAVVPAAALIAWALVLWLGVTALLTLAGQLPGVVGRGAAALARSIAPRAVRRAVELTLGLSLAAGAAAGPASAAPLAGADTAAAPAAAAAPSLDWPGTGAAPPAPVTAAAPAPPQQPAAAATAEPVVVAPGDTLWSVTHRALGPGATTEQVAAAWPAWWAANRDVIGPDPHLIHPGDRLTPPSAPSSRP